MHLNLNWDLNSNSDSNLSSHLRSHLANMKIATEFNANCVIGTKRLAKSGRPKKLKWEAKRTPNSSFHGPDDSSALSCSICVSLAEASRSSQFAARSSQLATFKSRRELTGQHNDETRWQAQNLNGRATQMMI